MASGLVRTTLATGLLLAGMLGAGSALQAQTGEFHKSQGRLEEGTAQKKTFALEAFNSGLCQSQPNPTLIIYPDGHQVFTAQVRSAGNKDTFQAFVRYFNVAGSFLTEVKWWQFQIGSPNVWHIWKIETKADPAVAAKFKDMRKVVFNYRC